MCEIKNTIKFTFSNGCEKPNVGEVATFVKALDVDPGQVEAAYRMAEEKSLFVKFKTEESMLHALNFNPEESIFRYENGKEAVVRMLHAGEFIQYVRVYDLPPEVSDQELALVLGKYGKVKRVIREKFPAELNFDAYTGVRGIYMDVKKEIPTSLHFLNRKGNIFYAGNKDKCFVCKMEGHRMNSCPKRKNRKQPEKENGERDQDEQGSDISSYAGAVAGAAAVETTRTRETTEVLDAEVMAIDEMISDSETEENKTDKQASGSQIQQRGYQDDPKYLAAKEIINQLGKSLKQKTEEMKNEERRKLQARKKASGKQSPSRSPHRK